MLACGRRWGKSELGADLLAEVATQGFPVAWYAPTYKLLADIWRMLRANVRNITVRASDAEHRIELTTGGVIEAWTLDNPDSSRGRKYARVFLDEAAMVSRFDEAWNGAVRPTLTDYRGDAWFGSTPKGLNYFWHLYQRGLDPEESDWRSWQMPTSTNPYIDPEEIEAARKSTPDRWFRQEYLAEFIEDAGAVFRGVTQAATADQQAGAIEDHEYIVGVDWGKMEDFTVFAVVDTTTEQCVALDRSNQVDYHVQRQRLHSLCDRFRPWLVVAERNSIGEPIIEQLVREGLPVQPFVTTNQSKAAAIEALALAIETGRLSYISDPVLLGELQAFELERLPSGMVRYSAPEGMHDDCVMALALAWSPHAANATFKLWT